MTPSGLPPDPRRDAATVLVEALSGRATSTDLLNRALSRYPADRTRDASLLHELVLGVLRRHLALRAVIEPHVRGPWDRLEPSLRAVLECAAYQALFLARIPPHARVGAAVDAARVLSGEGGSRLVNGVCRSFERTVGPDLLASLPPAVLHSVPEAVLARMEAAAGRPIEPGELAALSERAPSVYRVNRRFADRDAALARLSELGEGCGPTAFAIDGISVSEAVASRVQPLVPGLLLPQDEASQLVVEALAPRDGERVADLCAGRGVKTAQILSVAPGADVLAVDRTGRRLHEASALALAQGLPALRTLAGDAATLPAGLRGTFDAVLLDAPCTGIGTLRRRPEVRYVRRPGDFAAAAAIQERLLRGAVDLVAPGGRLVYAVCSFAPEEGEDVVRRVLADRPDLSIEPVDGAVPAPIRRPDGTCLSLPWRDGMDGFYFARLRRNLSPTSESGR